MQLTVDLQYNLCFAFRYRTVFYTIYPDRGEIKTEEARSVYVPVNVSPVREVVGR